MVIFGGVIAAVGALSIACHFKSINSRFETKIKFEGEKAMSGIIMMVTGFKRL